MVVVSELGCWEKVRPIVLLPITEHPNICLHPFIEVFNLSLGLWVIWSGEPLIDAKTPEEPSGVLCSKQRTPIGIMDLRNPVEFPYVFQVKLSQVLSCRPGGGGDEMGHLGKPVHDDIDGVMSS